MEKLSEAQSKCSDLHGVECDASAELGRNSLFSKISHDFPTLDVLFINAGILQYVKANVAGSWGEVDREIQKNLGALVHLPMLFAEDLSRRNYSAILVTASGLVYVPLAHAPAYSATEAALHSFTLSQRHPLLTRGVEVIKISPTIVGTAHEIPGTHTSGITTGDFSDAAIEGIKNEALEITHEFSTKSAYASRADRDEMFRKLNVSNS